MDLLPTLPISKPLLTPKVAPPPRAPSVKPAGQAIGHAITQLFHPPAPPVYHPPASHVNLRGPLVTHPFAAAQHQAARRVAAATPKLPAALPQVPVLAHYTPAQKTAIVNRVGAAIVQRQAQTGLNGNDLYHQSQPSDQAAIRLYVKLNGERSLAAQQKAVNNYAHLLSQVATPTPAMRANANTEPGATTVIPQTAGLKQSDFTPSAGRAAMSAEQHVFNPQAVQRVNTDSHVDLGPLGTIDVTKLLAPAVMQEPGTIGAALGNLGGLARNAVTDAVTLPAAALQTVYQAGKAGVAAAGGNTRPAQQILDALAAQLHDPMGTIYQHPVSSLLQVAGGEFAAGRLAGDAARAAGSDVAATARPDLPLYGDLRVTGRSYSPDPLRKGVQVAAERVQQKRAGVEPGVATPRQVKKAVVGTVTQPGMVDYAIAAGEQNRRNLKSAATGAASEVKPKVGADAVRPIVEGVIRRPDTAAEDLQKYRQMLIDQQPSLTGERLAANQDTLKRVDGLLSDTKFLGNPSAAFAAARAYNTVHAPVVDRLVEHGALQPEELRARLFPYAQLHMGAKYDTVPRATPEALARYGQAKRVELGARQAMAKAEREYTQAVSARGNLFGRQRMQIIGDKKTGGAVAPAKVAARGRDRQAVENAVQVAASERRAQRANLTDAIAARKAVAPKKQPPGLVGPDGKPLSNEAIHEHMRANGVDPNQVGFVSQEPSLLSSSSFYKAASRRPAVTSKTRTGQAFREGTYPLGYESLVAQLAKSTNSVAGHEGWNSLLNRFASGTFEDTKAGQHAAENFLASPEGQRIEGILGKHQVVPVGSKQVVQALSRTGKVRIGSAHDLLDQLGLQEHRPFTETPGGRFALMPEAVVKRIEQHQEALRGGSGKKLAQWVTQKFRSTALFTSPRWLLGDPQEHAIRLAWSGAAPKVLGGRSGRLGARLEKSYAELAAGTGPTADAARHTAAQLLGYNGVYGGAKNAELYRSGEQFLNTALERPAGALEHTGEVRGVHQIVGAWNRYRNVIARGMQGVDHASRRAALGKAAIRELHQFNGKWSNVLKMTDAEVRRYAADTLEPSRTAALAHATDEMMGNFRNLTPGVRAVVQNFSPFGLWWLNSMRFLARSPIDHPLKTGVLAALYNATQAQRKEDEQAYLKQHPGQPYPPYLTGGIHIGLPAALGGGATINPAYYSPGGVGIDPLETAGGMIGPQYSGIYNALHGVNDLGQPISGPDVKKYGGRPSEADKLTVLFNTALENMVPGVRMARQIAQKGGSAYDTSTLPAALLDRLGGKQSLLPQPATRKRASRGWAATLLKALGPERLTFETPATKSASNTGTSSGGGFDWGKAQQAAPNSGGFDWSKAQAPSAGSSGGFDWSKAKSQ